MVLPLTPVRLKLHAAEVFGGKEAVVCGEARFTYREFNERADRLSTALVELGVREGDRVAYLSFNCHRLLEAYFGVPQLGAILLPLNIRLSAEELAQVCLGAPEHRHAGDRCARRRDSSVRSRHVRWRGQCRPRL